MVCGSPQSQFGDDATPILWRKMVSATTNSSSESIEIDPGSSVKFAVFRLARGVNVEELFKVRRGGGPLFRPSCFSP